MRVLQDWHKEVGNENIDEKIARAKSIIREFEIAENSAKNQSPTVKTKTKANIKSPDNDHGANAGIPKTRKSKRKNLKRKLANDDGTENPK